MRLTTALLTSLVLGGCLVETEPGEPEDLEETEALARACHKVDVCHIPPGNPANAHTISVSPAAVPAHLAHGDHLGACGGGCVPTPEVCGDTVDNDCDGNVDEGCVCPPGETWDCYSYPLETDGIGTCQRGTKTCNADGTGYGACVGEIGPVPEVCGDGLDNDCDFAIDDGCATACVPGSMAPCYSGPAGTDGVGACHGGTTVCTSDGSGYGACGGEVTPAPEVCGDGVDNNCDGQTDETCVCVPGTFAPCYTGPAGTQGVGACHGGTQVCAADGSGYGACGGEVTPSADVCGDGVDNDCDGLVDEGCIGDRAWNDTDRDGIQDSGEVGLAGATFVLRSASTGAVIAVAVSDVFGQYYFAGMPAGNYYIEVITPPGFTLSDPNQGTNDNVDSDFDSESGGYSDPFAFGGGTDDRWDAGFYSVIQS